MNIGDQLREIASYGGFFALTVGDDPADWIPVRHCYDQGCADLVAATAARYDTADLRIGASLVQFSHASRLWSPLLACALRYGVLPDLTDLQRHTSRTDLRLPVPVGAPVDGPLAQQLYRRVITEHLEPLAAGFRVKMAPRLLYGNAAAALVAAGHDLAQRRPELDDDIVAVTEALLVTGELAGTGDLTGLTFRRRSCCLYYRVPGGSNCGDCALTRPRA
ncbi:(2Fe-2S)-binding protein [Mycolicibacterium setense]|uniref:Iron reductase n=1 Tax=Mycolicibacterium setense TaxID=431269 RepID=A0ABR4YNB7_9MYCO|nr:(2Fe-2S)-binding protein [Mycolicibacterium setense]KHO17970.1 iron reductase [Mycolicibacterium setense]KHO19751.1 iron reductase [Mycolicibacterium setense]MCV7112173.1 (2Fe-2S)-binding protein [Mycolicibacterium setense]